MDYLNGESFTGEGVKWARLAEEYQRKGHWLQAIDKHKRAAQAFHSATTQGHLNTTTLEALQAIARHHTNQASFITLYLDNIALKTAAKTAVKDLKALTSPASDIGMDKNVYKNLRDAFEGLVNLGQKLGQQLSDIDAQRRMSDLRLDVLDLTFNPNESFLFVKDDESSSSGAFEEKSSLFSGDMSTKVMEDFYDTTTRIEKLSSKVAAMEKSNSELRKVMLYLSDENNKLRDIVEEFHEVFREKLFELKAAIEMANIRSSIATNTANMSASINLQGLHIEKQADTKYSSSSNVLSEDEMIKLVTSLKDEVEVLQKSKMDQLEEIHKLQKQARIFEKQLMSEQKLTAKQEKIIKQWKKKWDGLRKAAQDRRNAKQGTEPTDIMEGVDE